MNILYHFHFKRTDHYFFFSSSRRHTSYIGDWSSDVCSSDLDQVVRVEPGQVGGRRAAQQVGRRGVEAHRQGRQDDGPVAGLLRAAEPEGEVDPVGRQVEAGIEIGRASCRERAESTGRPTSLK